MAGMNYGVKKRMDEANNRAEALREILTPLVEQGYSQRKICKELNALNIKTATGGVNWHPGGVGAILRRLKLKTAGSP